MRNKVMLLVGAAAGYVLGARAGRERYDQIADQANKLWSDPRVQEKVDEVKHKADEVSHKVGDQAKSKTEELKSKAGEVSGQAKSKAGEMGDQAKAKADEVQSQASGRETTGADGTYENQTGSYDPNTGTTVDTSSFGPGGEKLP